MFKYAHLVAEEQEMEWVMALDGRAMNAVEIAKMMSVPFEEAESFLARAIRRAVMDKRTRMAWWFTRGHILSPPDLSFDAGL
jgi:hypothetical protein